MSHPLRHDFEQHLLTLLRRRPVIDLPSVVRLHALCQQQLAHETNSAWMTFWNLASRYFSGLRRALITTPGVTCTHKVEISEGSKEKP